MLSGLTSAETAADSPSEALACSAGGINVALPAGRAEGTLSPNPVSAGGSVSLVANSADAPNGALSGGTLLNGPDTGLGFEIQFPTLLEALTTAGSHIGFSGTVPLTVTGGTGTPTLLEALTTAGSHIGFSGTVPLTVTGGTGTPTLNVSGTFTVPATYPTGNVFVSVPGTVSGAITAGSTGTVSVGLPAFTSTNLLTLSLTGVSTVAIPLTCTTTAAQTISSATIGTGGGTTTTTTSSTTTTTSTTSTTTTTAPTTTTTAAAATHAPADSPTYSLSCTAAGVPVNLPLAVTEGVFSSNPVAAGAVDNLKANPQAVPNSLFGAYDARSNPNGVNLLNGPDTGLGVVVEFPTALEPLTTPGDTVTFSGTLPLTVTGGIGTPSLNLSGSFTVPSTYPTHAAVAVTGTQSGTITAGQQTTMTVTQQQFSTASPLTLTVSIGTTPVSITCVSSALETLDTATITGGNGTPTPPNPPSPGTATGAGASTAAPAADAAGAKTLAFTGMGPGIWGLGIAGLVLIDLGFLLVTIYYRPRNILAVAARRATRLVGGSRP